MLWQLITGWMNYTKVHVSYLVGDDERGQGLVEYALVLVMVSLVMVLLLTVLGPGIQNIYRNVVEVLNAQQR